MSRQDVEFTPLTDPYTVVREFIVGELKAGDRPAVVGISFSALPGLCCVVPLTTRLDVNELIESLKKYRDIVYPLTPAELAKGGN